MKIPKAKRFEKRPNSQNLALKGQYGNLGPTLPSQNSPHCRFRTTAMNTRFSEKSPNKLNFDDCTVFLSRAPAVNDVSVFQNLFCLFVCVYIYIYIWDSVRLNRMPTEELPLRETLFLKEKNVALKQGYLFNRNVYLASKGFPVPKAKKTGTTIVGVVYEDGVVLGADTRATVGSLVADKNCMKIHYLAPNMYCCGAGTAADTEQVCRMIASQLELHRLATDRIVPVAVAEKLITQHLFRYQGYVSAALIVGGVDLSGPSIYLISPHGSSENLPYGTMGSGSLAAMSVFEKGWKSDMKLDEAKQLVRDAIASGIYNDLGSGSNVDLCVITRAGAEMIRPYDVTNMKGQIQGTYSYAPGTTAVLSSKTVPLEIVETVTRPTRDAAEEAMDTA
ncbi:Proteasome subunit beta type-7 [Araneus ventricosus]|uniref:proteasome endopeptidase complex n=1 Tax=Araneus ventricosus TaxID=182803 RepID=A0A4Y2PLX4_ARAVE|nr:Proteasome subunit beta type-7 [Araneus ventricosus]